MRRHVLSLALALIACGGEQARESSSTAGATVTAEAPLEGEAEEPPPDPVPECDRLTAAYEARWEARSGACQTSEDCGCNYATVAGCAGGVGDAASVAAARELALDYQRAGCPEWRCERWRCEPECVDGQCRNAAR